MTFLGSISYPLFLTHFLVLYILSWAVINHLPVSGFLQYTILIHASLMVVSVALAVAISTLIHNYTELPFTTWGKRVYVKK